MNEPSVDFCEALHRRIHQWLETDAGKAYAWSDHLVWTPDMLRLLIKLTFETEVAAEEKVRIAGSLAYFLTPADFIPESVAGGAGFADDLLLAAHVASRVIEDSGASVVRRHWTADVDVVEITQAIIGDAEAMVGAVLWGKLKALVD